MRPIKLLFALLAFLLPAFAIAQYGFVSTIAGQLYPGFSGDGGPAVNAQLHLPGSVKLDAHGNIYIADAYNQRIRRIDGITGVITTVAGIGTQGFSGDGGAATNAQLRMPGSIAFDTAGNLLICDQLNWRVRKIDANGIINTIAGTNMSWHDGDGGPAINASFWNPNWIEVDAHNNIYVAEDARIRKIDGQTGLISTIAGTGVYGSSGIGGLAVNADIYGVQAMALDLSGNLYFIDDSTFQVRKIDVTSGIITNFAGNGTLDTAGDGGLAVNSGLDFPKGLYVDANNDVYISEQFRIRKVDANTGIINTIAGKQLGGFTPDGTPALLAGIAPGCLARDHDGDLLFGSHAEGKIHKISTDIPFVNLSSSDLSVQVYTQCNGPQFICLTNQYDPTHSIHTWYGDGTNDTNITTQGYVSDGFASFGHTYPLSGSYPVKHVLYNNGIAIDSLQYTLPYNMCRTVSVDLYVDGNANCTYETVSDVQSVQPSLIAVDSNGITVDTVTTLSGFVYNMKGGVGDIYSFHVVSVPTGLQTSCPVSGVITDTIQSVGYSGSKKFGLECNNTTSFDLSVTKSFIRTAANRFDVDIVVFNNFCQPQSVVLDMIHSPKYEYTQFTAGATHPAPSSITGNVFSWNFSNVSALGMPKYVHAALWATNNQILTPGVDTVQTKLTVGPTVGDVDLTNNIVISDDTATGPYDPNAVYVDPGSCVLPGTNLKYTITFENLGNDTAHDVYIMDTLSDGFDMQSMKMVVASHVMTVTKVSNGGYNILKFDFPGIDLADSSSPARHGFVQYTIDTKDNYPIGSAVTNHAGIYFDYMPAVLTNVASTTMCWPTNINTVAKSNTEIYPNPAREELVIKTDKTYTSYTITSSVGQAMMASDLSAKQTVLNIKALPPGIYYISLKGDGITDVRKFVKL